MKMTNRERVKAELATACAAEIQHEDNILAYASTTGEWGEIARLVSDHRDAKGSDHAIACHRNH